MPAGLAWLGKGTRVQTQASDGRWYLSKVVGVRARRPRADIRLQVDAGALERYEAAHTGSAAVSSR